MTSEPGRSALSAAAIAEYWAANAERHGLDPASSWSDHRAIELEIAAIAGHVPAGARVLDAGSATGYSTVRYAGIPDVRVTGVDVVPKMVELATERTATLPAELAERVDFSVADVRALPFDDASFDVAITTRVVINLADRDEQRRALGELARVVRPGGTLLLSEATDQGWRRLNVLRAEWGLTEIPVPAFNLYLDEEELIAWAERDLVPVDVEDFASTYYVVTRVLKPLLARAAAVEVDNADPDAELNRWASLLPAAGDYGTQKLFVFRRRGQRPGDGADASSTA